MSTEGMFINDVWVAKRPSWWRKRQLKGSAKDRSPWTQALLLLLGAASLGCLLLAGASVRVATVDLGQWRALVFTGFFICLAIFVRYMNGPERRASYRRELVYKGELLTPDDPAGRLVLFAVVVNGVHVSVAERWAASGRRARPLINSALADFASGMAASRKQFNDPYWYLNAGAEQQAAWHKLSAPDMTSPLGRLCDACALGPSWFYKMLVTVLDTQTTLHRLDRQFESRQWQLKSRIQDCEDVIFDSKRQLAEINEQLMYDPAAGLRSITTS